MNTRIALDYIFRKKWIFVISFIVHMLVTMGFWNTDKFMVVVFAMGGSGFLLLFEMMRSGGKGPKTLLSLPITSKELARTWKFVGLEFPIIFAITAFSFGAMLAHVFGMDKYLTAERFLISVLVQSVLLGTVFFALTCMPSSPQDRNSTSIKESVKNTIFGLVYGFSLPASFVILQYMPNKFSEFGPGHVAFSFLLIFATIAGWFRAEELVRKRTSQTNRISSSNPRGAFKNPSAIDKSAWQKFGGFKFFHFRFGRFCLVMGLAIFLFNTYGMQFFMKLQSRGSSSNPAFNQMEMIAPVIALVIVANILSMLRSFRVLPISRATLTSFLIFTGVGASGIFSALIVSLLYFLFDQSPDWIGFSTVFPSSIIILFSIPVLLRFGMQLKGFVGVCLILPFAQAGSIIVDRKSPDVPISVTMTIFAVIIVIGLAILWPLVYRMLGTSYPWREGALKMISQNRA